MIKTLKKELINPALCPVCAASLGLPQGEIWSCSRCGHRLHFYQGIPLFTEPPGELVPLDICEPGPQLGSTWRQANWKFLQAQAECMPAIGTVLDVGECRVIFPVFLPVAPKLPYHISPTGLKRQTG